MTLRRFFFLFAALLLSTQLACAKKPTMKLNHAEISGVQVGFPPQVGIMMTLVVDVTNPNSYDVAVRAMRGQVVFADKYPLPINFQGPPDGVWLPSGQTTSMRVPINVPVDLGLQLLRESFQSPTIGFRMQGKADVTATRSLQIEKDDYEVDEKGTITRDQIAASLQSVFPFGIPGAAPAPITAPMAPH